MIATRIMSYLIAESATLTYLPGIIIVPVVVISYRRKFSIVLRVGCRRFLNLSIPASLNGVTVTERKVTVTERTTRRKKKKKVKKKKKKKKKEKKKRKKKKHKKKKKTKKKTKNQSNTVTPFWSDYKCRRT